MSDSKFRPLNENEIKAIESAKRKGKIVGPHPILSDGDATVSYEKMQGGFCICIIIARYQSKSFMFRGASRRSYKDTRNDIRGEMLAFSRALLYSRPVEMT